jgi:hypothetical protein
MALMYGKEKDSELEIGPRIHIIAEYLSLTRIQNKRLTLGSLDSLIVYPHPPLRMAQYASSTAPSFTVFMAQTRYMLQHTSSALIQ